MSEQKDKTFEFSKEGFASRFKMINDSKEILEDEYEGFRESEMDEILYSKGSSNSLNWIITVAFLTSISLMVLGTINQISGLFFVGLGLLIPSLFLVYKNLNFYKNIRVITLGDRQEIIDHLLKEKLISNKEASRLHTKLIKILSEE